jgi:hypothetical protein
VDSVHVQRCTIARPGELFAGSWYETYNPCDDLQHLFDAARKQPAKPAAGVRRSQTTSKQA